jgi:hypothetical protein
MTLKTIDRITMCLDPEAFAEVKALEARVTMLEALVARLLVVAGHQAEFGTEHFDLHEAVEDGRSMLGTWPLGSPV